MEQETIHHTLYPPLPAFAEDAQIFTMLSPSISTFILKPLPGSALGAPD